MIILILDGKYIIDIFFKFFRGNREQQKYGIIMSRIRILVYIRSNLKNILDRIKRTFF